MVVGIIAFDTYSPAVRLAAFLFVFALVVSEASRFAPLPYVSEASRFLPKTSAKRDADILLQRGRIEPADGHPSLLAKLLPETVAKFFSLYLTLHDCKHCRP